MLKKTINKKFQNKNEQNPFESEDKNNTSSERDVPRTLEQPVQMKHLGW